MHNPNELSIMLKIQIMYCKVLGHCLLLASARNHIRRTTQVGLVNVSHSGHQLHQVIPSQAQENITRGKIIFRAFWSKTEFEKTNLTKQY